MNRKKLFLLIVISFASGTFAQAQTNEPFQETRMQATFDPLFNDPALNRFLNPSESEEEYVYSIQQPPPPSTLLVWLRIIGVPIINAFFTVRKAVRESVAWILAKLKNDTQDAQLHAQN